MTPTRVVRIAPPTPPRVVRIAPRPPTPPRPRVVRIAPPLIASPTGRPPSVERIDPDPPLITSPTGGPPRSPSPQRADYIPSRRTARSAKWKGQSAVKQFRMQLRSQVQIQVQHQQQPQQQTTPTVISTSATPIVQGCMIIIIFVKQILFTLLYNN